MFRKIDKGCFKQSAPVPGISECCQRQIWSKVAHVVIQKVQPPLFLLVLQQLDQVLDHEKTSQSHLITKIFPAWIIIQFQDLLEPSVKKYLSAWDPLCRRAHQKTKCVHLPSRRQRFLIIHKNHSLLLQNLLEPLALGIVLSLVPLIQKQIVLWTCLPVLSISCHQSSFLWFVPHQPVWLETSTHPRI